MKVLLLIGFVAVSQAGLLGGWRQMDPNSPEVKELADFASGEISKAENTMYGSVAMTPVKASYQVVAGMNYKLTFERRRTKCMKTVTDLSSCELGDQSQMCTVTVYRDLQSVMHLNNNFQCDTKMAKRAGGISAPLTGDLSAYKDIAVRAFSMQNSAMTDLEIKSVRTQTVAGTNYYMTVRGKEGGKYRMCDVTVWSRPWLNDGFQVTKFSCDNNMKRALVGGVQEKTGDLSPYLVVVRKAFTMQNSALKINKVLSASTQVVAGINYKLKVEAMDGDETQVCSLEVYDKPWIAGSFQVSKFDCQKSMKRGLAGGIKEQSGDLTKYSDVLQRAFSMQNSDMKISKILSVSEQVVAGVLYRMKVEAKDGAETKVCSVNVWDKAWDKDFFQVTQFDCQPKTQKRSFLAGGITKQSGDFSIYSDLVQRAFSMTNSPLKVSKILAVSTQVVQGTIYRFKLEATDGDKTKICEMNIWYRPWITDGLKVNEFTC